MTHQEQQAIREYFYNILKFKDKNDYLEYSVSTLAFSYLMGMDPNECRYMEVESDWTPDLIQEYEDIEGFIHRLIKEFE